MEIPKCKLCGERHWHPPCPATKSSSEGGESRPVSKPRKVAGSVRTGSLPRKERERPTEVGQVGVASNSLEAKPNDRDNRSVARKAPKSPGRLATNKLAVGVIGVSPELVAPASNLPKRGRPRVEDRDKTIESQKPWVADGMSRATWYARRKANQRGEKS